ncbi:MAG: molecular chaperone DnaJ [Desulfomicrobium sp.]|jgi:molecular chaperone DnaJ|nr:molecular chaperone DnaJ [Desulfomicrobium sp.]NLV97932.1 molecular chaperone DnaJ [Desulfovibrionales bacterium]
MSTKRDYYEVLGIENHASADEIKSAYRKLALKYHPDRNPDDPDAEDKFKEAAEAYEILSDSGKRAQYDRFGHAGINGQGFGDHFHSTEDVFSAFGDIFGDLFGFGAAAGGRRRARAGADLRYNLNISFRDAAKGTEVELNIPKKEVCSDCHGQGSAPGHTPETCQHCHGQGQVTQSQGFFRISVPCPVCRGEGKVITHPCPKCRGNGIVQVDKNLKVRIPAGVDTGSRLRLRNEGEPGDFGGPYGDLYVVIYVEDDKIFARRGQDLVVSADISIVQAILGAKIEVPTIDEPVTLEIPKGTQSGKILRIKNMGLPYLGSTQKGDLLVEVLVHIPTKITKKQEELLREFDRLEEGRPIKKVKDFFKKAMGD